jgi:SAM-dependent methyltransferase
VSPQRTAELEFWRGEFRKYPTPELYVAQRKSELQSYLVPEILHEDGRGLDLGCGLVSVLSSLEMPEVLAADPLMHEYARICMPFDNGVKYFEADGEKLPKEWEESFDFVWCMNAIDHTPHPKVMLCEIRRALRPGGRLYFSVNFDPALYAPHYHLWDMRTVEDAMKGWKLIRGTLEWHEQWGKYIWTAIYV